MKITVKNQTIETGKLVLIGSGGEADIYRLDPSTALGTSSHALALKIFKDRNHPDYTGNPSTQMGAEFRLKEHQQKLPAFPRNLPANVVTPEALAYDCKGIIRGYLMSLVSSPKTLWSYSQPGAYIRGKDEVKISAVFSEMHKVTEEIHKRQVVIGDFNDLNVLIDGLFKVWFIDADSYQFGKFYSKTFDERFVDPKLCIIATPKTHPDICADGKSHILMAKPYSTLSDWYSFAIHFMQTLLSVGPYGGVYSPQNKKAIVPPQLRPMHRISLFKPEVIYPKKARPLEYLPDDLTQYFYEVFVKDLRGIFPVHLIQNLRFTACSSCGTVHAKAVCPGCQKHSAQPVTAIVHGKLNATRLFKTNGLVVTACFTSGKLYFIYHDGSSYRMEDKREILAAAYDNRHEFKIGDKTLAYKNGSVLTVVRGYGNSKIYPVDDTHQGNTFSLSGEKPVWVSEGSINTEETIVGERIEKKIADVISGNTAIWTGESYGFGRYRAGELMRHFIFSLKNKGLYDSICIPAWSGNLIDSMAYLSESHIWYFLLLQDGSKRIVLVYCLDRDGKIIGEAKGDYDDGSWLGGIHGKLAAGNFLLSPSDDGIVRIDVGGGLINVTKRFADTDQIVDRHSKLLPGNNGLHVISEQDIWKISIS